MKLVFVSQEFPPNGGGIASQTFTKAERLSRRGHDVFVLTLEPVPTPTGPVRFSMIDVSGSRDSRLLDSTEEVRWLMHSLDVADSLQRFTLSTSPDLIDFAEYGGEAYCFLLNRTEWNHIPVTIQLHGPLAMLTRTIGWPEPGSRLHSVGSHMEGMSVRLADAVYSSSRCSAEWCEEEYGLDASGVPVLHTGIDTRFFRPGLSEKDTFPTVIFVGRVDRSKGVEILLEACLRLCSQIPSLRLRLCGRENPQLLKSMLERAKDRGCPDLIEFLGPVSREQLPIELCRAQVFAAPSFYEGGPGFVYLEAMACGLPVIGCSGSGLDEVVTSGENGVLVGPGSVERLTEALKKLLSDSDYRRSIGSSAREWTVSNVDSATCIQKLEAFYQSVIERQRR